MVYFRQLPVIQTHFGVKTKPLYSQSGRWKKTEDGKPKNKIRYHFTYIFKLVIPLLVK